MKVHKVKGPDAPVDLLQAAFGGPLLSVLVPVHPLLLFHTRGALYYVLREFGSVFALRIFKSSSEIHICTVLRQ